MGRLKSVSPSWVMVASLAVGLLLGGSTYAGSGDMRSTLSMTLLPLLVGVLTVALFQFRRWWAWLLFVGVYALLLSAWGSYTLTYGSPYGGSIMFAFFGASFLFVALTEWFPRASSLPLSLTAGLLPSFVPLFLNLTAAWVPYLFAGFGLVFSCFAFFLPPLYRDSFLTVVEKGEVNGWPTFLIDFVGLEYVEDEPGKLVGVKRRTPNLILVHSLYLKLKTDTIPILRYGGVKSTALTKLRLPFSSTARFVVLSPTKVDETALTELLTVKDN